jgi:hypothetical protein
VVDGSNPLAKDGLVSTSPAVLKVAGAIPMPLSSSVYALIAHWQSLGVPDDVIVAALLEFLIGRDATERVDRQQQSEADAVARAMTDRDAAQLLRTELAEHAIVQHWANWARVFERIRDRRGSLTRDQLAEIYRRFCAGELTTEQKIDDAMDALFAPVVSRASGPVVPPGRLP